jgi:hypothetical protein
MACTRDAEGKIKMLGHNNPPSEKEILQERLALYKEIPEKLENLKLRAIPEKIKDEKEAGNLTLFIKNLKDVVSDSEKIRKKEKEIYIDCGRVVDAWHKGYAVIANELIAKASKPLLAFQAEKERIERARQLEIAARAKEEAEKLMAEAAAHEAVGINDTAQDLMNFAVQSEVKAEMIENNLTDIRMHTRHSLGAVSSTSKVWTGEVDLLAALDLDKLRNFISLDALDKAVKAYAKKTDGAELQGARIYQQAKLNIR